VLVCHLDTSRSGLLFHPAVAAHLSTWFRIQAAACLFAAAEPLLGGGRNGRRLAAMSRAGMAAGALLLAERELRGVDVPGANDNASGVAVVAELAAELAANPLESTRVIVLMTGCEESGLLGAQAFLRSRDTSGWLFLNFDSVGGPGTLRFVRREGVVRMWESDPALVSLAEDLSARRPELGLESADGPIGLTYDTSPVLAAGGRAMTFVNGDGGLIPNYHQPTDTPDRLDPAALAAALEAGREMVRAIDRGEAG
jgi:Zn-dependent M28 family amino/carboxypeptidase